MLIDTLNSHIEDWTNWASNDAEHRYDIALFKIWMKMELFISEIFIDYCVGKPSESGYAPSLNLQFRNPEQLQIFLREGSKPYVEYLKKIEKLSTHIFVNNPFEILFMTSNYSSVYNEVQAIRNFVAHESGTAQSKYVNACLSGNNFLEPHIYLQKKESTSNTTYYSYYISNLKNIAQLLVTPVET